MSAVAAVAMFASCSNDSLVSDTAPASDPQIKFNTSMKNITRAVTTNNDFTSFKVSAFEEGNTTAHFSDKEVLKTGGSWQASEKVYWPKSGKALNFFAYSPTSLAPTTTSTGISITGFNLSTSLTDQKDILVAYQRQQYDATSGADNTVSLSFKHALSNIVILARNETAGAYEVKVKGVRVGKVNSSGDLYFNGTNCTWSNQGDIVSYDIGGKEDSNYDVVDVVKSNSTSSNFMNGQELLIIPQSSSIRPVWTKADNDNGSRISICCQIYSGSTRIFPAADLTTVQYGWISVPLPDSYEWEAGKKYIYTVRFFPNGTGNTGNVDPEDPDIPEGPSDPIPDIAIDFTATIDEWTNGNGDTGETIPSE